jgi:hypothetical protein
MAIITGGNVIAGGRPQTGTGTGRPLTWQGVPPNGAFNGIAPPDALCRNVATGLRYRNTGTLAATIWTAI